MKRHVIAAGLSRSRSFSRRSTRGTGQPNLVANIEDPRRSREVGGDRVAVDFTRGYQDPHFVEAKPAS
jgi:hypothetical protein